MMNVLNKAILPLLFLMVLFMWFFDFVQIRIVDADISLSGFDFFRNVKNIANIKIVNIWFILVFLLGCTGLALSCFKSKANYRFGFLVALGGVVFLLVGQSDIINMLAAEAMITFRPAYWLSLSLFCLAGCICYLRQDRNDKKKEEDTQKKVLHINIFTGNTTADKSD